MNLNYPDGTNVPAIRYEGSWAFFATKEDAGHFLFCGDVTMASQKYPHTVMKDGASFRLSCPMLGEDLKSVMFSLDPA